MNHVPLLNQKTEEECFSLLHFSDINISKECLISNFPY